MKKMLLAVSLVVAAVANAPSAHAFGLSAVGSYNIPTLSITPAPVTLPTTSGTIGFGGLLSFGAFPGFDFEVGALYTPYTVEVPSVSKTTWNSLMIPVLLRFKLLPIVSVAGGLFYDLPLTDGTVTGSGSSTVDIKSNFGATLSGALRFPIAPTLGLLIDGRYNIGLKDTSTVAGQTSKMGGVQILAGLNFSL
ncbi:MAG: hypothetical protein JNL01_01500 [Bdellovibrionales bacterium]|nr:hypothetical protein [Bdellovibrionales bacterium]